MASIQKAFSANGDSDIINTQGGEFKFISSGTFGSGTVTVNYSNDGGSTFYALATLTATGSSDLKIPAGQIKLTLTGATGPTITSILMPMELASRN